MRELTEQERATGIGSFWRYNFSTSNLWLGTAFLVVLGLGCPLFFSLWDPAFFGWAFFSTVAYALGVLMQQFNQRSRTVLTLAVFSAALSLFLAFLSLGDRPLPAQVLTVGFFGVWFSLLLIYNLIRVYEEKR